MGKYKINKSIQEISVSGCENIHQTPKFQWTSGVDLQINGKVAIFSTAIA